MTIQLPKELERFVRQEVANGRFTSEDEVVAAAVRAYADQCAQIHKNASKQGGAQTDPLLGSMADAADELDEIVADAMKRRREEPWRAIAGE